MITYEGLAEDAITPAGSVNHFEQVAAAMGVLPKCKNSFDPICCLVIPFLDRYDTWREAADNADARQGEATK